MFSTIYFFKLGFTPKQLLQGMELQEKEEDEMDKKDKG